MPLMISMGEIKSRKKQLIDKQFILDSDRILSWKIDPIEGIHRLKILSKNFSTTILL